ncbi:MAG: anaerobic glycerol-3-phosphate dehydrogenase subunit C [Clostridia bacterium]|nr:anaerobic glycerol-3-phosphate dehydrogenase subunit C [Clostridia bacterium]
MSNEKERNLDYCLKCSTCHTQCPVVKSHLPFPGPKQMGPELERLRLARGNKETLEIDEALNYCTNCKRCDLACPHGVKPSFYNLKNKGKLQNKFLIRFRDWILAHNVWWSKMAGRVPALANLALRLSLTKRAMGMVGIADRDFPIYRKHPIKISKAVRDKKALYYAGCYASYNEPQIIQAAVNILESCGYQVELAPVACCGTPMVSNGLWDETARLAGKNTDIFLKYIEQGYKIVTTCPSCGLALKEEYEQIIPGEKSKILKANVWELFELLEEEDNLPFEPAEKLADKAYYHVPCHLKAQGIGIPAANLLKDLAVDELVVDDNYCCGISGTYGFKKEKYPIAMDIGKPLFDDIKKSRATLVISDCGTCKLQIVHGTGIEVKHPAEILARYLKKAQ